MTTPTTIYEVVDVANLHIQTAVAPNVGSLVIVILASSFNNYACWHDQVLLALKLYILVDYVLSDPP